LSRASPCAMADSRPVHPLPGTLEAGGGHSAILLPCLATWMVQPWIPLLLLPSLARSKPGLRIPLLILLLLLLLHRILPSLRIASVAWCTSFISPSLLRICCWGCLALLSGKTRFIHAGTDTPLSANIVSFFLNCIMKTFLIFWDRVYLSNATIMTKTPHISYNTSTSTQIVFFSHFFLTICSKAIVVVTRKGSTSPIGEKHIL